MFAFTWLFGFGFWALYIVLGLVFCVFYMRKFAKNIYQIVIGKADKDGDGDWEVDGQYIMRVEVFFVICAGFIFWPIAFIIVSAVGLFQLLANGFINLMISAIRKMASKLPEIHIKTEKPDETL